MPIYEYRCANGHSFEVFQSMSEDAVTECSECGAPVERVFHPIAVHFKGSGFYTTDYAKKKATASPASDGDGSAKSEPGSKSDSASNSDSGSGSSGSGESGSKASGNSSSSSAAKSGSSTSD